MMKLWRRRGVDRLLVAAAAAGTVLAGVSAGAICWCAAGVSDSRSFTAGDEPRGRTSPCAASASSTCCWARTTTPTPAARTGLRRLARTRRLVGIGLDDCTALEVVDDRYRILSCRAGSVGHRRPVRHRATCRPTTTSAPRRADLSGDVRMPEMDGLQATRRSPPIRAGRRPGAGADHVRSRRLRPRGAVRRGHPASSSRTPLPTDLLAAVRVVAAGDALLAPSITRRLIEDFVKRPISPTDDPRLDQLTGREREVLVAVAEGSRTPSWPSCSSSATPRPRPTSATC